MTNKTENLRLPDEIDCEILEILQKDCRCSLTDIAKAVNLSVDSVKKRVLHLEKEYFYPRVQIRPRKLGFSTIVDVKIKLRNHSEQEIERFVNYVVANPHIVEAFRVSGAWDFSLVIIAKDAYDLGEVGMEIKNKFGSMIDAWIESTMLKSYKFEYYDLKGLLVPGRS